MYRLTDLFILLFSSLSHADSIGLHRMENKSHVVPAITLHLYVPPYGSCQMFDQRTGKAAKCSVTFFSKGGKRTHGKEAKFTSENH